MVGPSHAIFALAATVAVGRTTGITPDRLGLLCVLLGALLPDIDGEGSITKPGSLLRGVLPRFAVSFFDWIGQMVAGFIRVVSKHRGFFHWPLLALVLMLVGYRYGVSWMSWLGFGYLTHILGDALTYEGVPFFAPWNRRSYGFSLFKTSSWTEALIDAVLLIFVVVWGYALLPQSYLEGFEKIFNYYRRLG